MMIVQDLEVSKIKQKDRARKDMGDIPALAQNILDKGLIQPITVDQHFRLLAGGRRLAAHIHLKKTTIRAIVRETSGTIDALEIELYENTQRKDLSWPEQAQLERRISDLETQKNPTWSQRQQAEKQGVALSTVNRRLQLAEALDTLPELAEFKTEDEAWKKYKKLEEDVLVSVMRAKNPPRLVKAVEDASRCYNVGDAFEGMAALPDGTFHFAEVDPPYGVALNQRKSRNKDEEAMSDYHEWEEYERLFEDTCREVYRLLQPHSFAVIWYGMSWHAEVLDTIRRVGFGAPDIPAVWIKPGGGQTAQPDTTLGSSYEPFFLARKGQPKLVKPGRSNVFSFDRVSKTVHPTEKPLALLQEIVNTTCFPGSNILIPFLGSGVSLRAAFSLGHTGIGWDLSEKHKEGFIQRVEEDAAKKK